MILRSIEFNGIPSGQVEVRISGKDTFILLPTHRDFITSFNAEMKFKKPLAFISLEKRYLKSKENRIYYEFLICQGFIKCNFLVHDNQLDIDENGAWRCEFILCPMTGECVDCGSICNSPDGTILSSRQIDVLRLIVAGMETKYIAEELNISPHTVHNHRNNMLDQLGLHNSNELVRYWFENNLK
jgi:DNA-binding CsgD family transcriptional regulator